MSEGTSSKALRCWIRLNGRDIEVRSGTTLVGRHESCQIIIDDPLASRRHARLSWQDGKLSIEDLGSVNGVLCKGKRITRSIGLANGDEFRIGNQRIEVFIGESDTLRRSFSAKTLVGEQLLDVRGGEEEELTAVRDGEALTTLALVAERVLAMGRGSEAEKLLEKPLSNVRAKVERGEAVDRETLELAAICAVRLGESTKKGAWLDYVIRLYTRLRMVMPGAVVDRMYTAVRAAESANIEQFRSYLEVLNQLKPSFGPGELFLLRRIEGLEQLLALK